MILDQLCNADGYRNLGTRLRAAFEFLREPSTALIEPDARGPENSKRIAIEDDDVFALVQRYETKQPSQAFWEAHRKYIDVQCVVEGTERMGWAPIDQMQIVTPYDPERDFMVLRPKERAIVNHIGVGAGMFAIFMPHDAHMPGLAVNDAAIAVKKIVVKVCAD